MAALTAKQVRAFVVTAQENYRRIDHEDWDAERSRYRTSDTAKWRQAAHEAVPSLYTEWWEIIRVLAQGESYYDGRY